MNTSYTAPRTTTRLAGAAFALVFTLAMLMGVGHLAHVDLSAAQLAQTHTSARS